MTGCWKKSEIGSIAPAKSVGMPDKNALVWNLSLEEVESVTGRILKKNHCNISELGSAKCSFDTRHVLYSKLRPYLNKVVLPDEPGVGTSELIPMCPDPNQLDREFLAFYLRSPMFLDFAKANTRGANLPRIAMKELWKHELPVPDSIVEQRRIVARIKECMERVEEIDKLRAEAIADSEKLQSAVFADYIESINDSGLGTTVLGDVIAECKYGTSKKANKNGSGVPILRMGNIKFGRIDTSDLKYVDLPKTERNKYLLEDGDVLINRTNSLELVGKSAVFLGLSGDWVYASYLIRLRIDHKKALPEYVNAVINSRIGRNYVLQTARRAIGMVNINAREIQRMPLPLPSIEEQAALIDKMNETEPLIDELLSFYKEDGLSHFRDSILRKAFAGEL